MHLCSPSVHLDCMRSREGSMNGGDMKLHPILGPGSVKKMVWPLFKLLRFLSAFFGHFDPIISVATIIISGPHAYIPNMASSPRTPPNVE